MEGEALVEVPAGAVTEGREIRVGVGKSLGRIDEGVLSQEFGAPVVVEHDQAIQKPVRLTWDVSHLSDEQRTSLVLVRWNSDLGVWAVAKEKPELVGGTLVAEVSEFSILTWVSGGVAKITQVIGEWTGKRSSGPTCSDAPLPGWVRRVVRPDESQPGVPIRTCVERDTGDVLTVRVSNNRPYSQSLDLVDGDQYAWTWSGDEDFTAAGIIRDSLNKAMSNDKTLVIAPVRNAAVGLERPVGHFVRHLSMASRPTVATVTSDVLSAVLGTVFKLDNVGGFDSEALNAFVQSIYDCGGKRLLASRELGGKDIFDEVLRIVKSCGDSDAVRSEIENVLRAQIAKGGKVAERAVRTNRGLHQVMGKLGVYLTVSDFASYSAELMSAGAIGDVRMSIFATGNASPLGSWTATCTNPDTDSGMLYTNLALQDAFRDASKELWEFSDWESSSRDAVKPLERCSPDHIARVAANVKKTWADKKAAAVVAKSIQSLKPTSGFADFLNATLPPNVCRASETMGWAHDGVIPLRGGRGVAREADGSFGGASVLETKILGQADMDGDGQQEVVLSMQCAGSEPEDCCAGRASLATTLGVFKPGPVLQQVASSLMGGESGPGNEFGPAARNISAATLRGTTIIATEYIVYSDNYTSDQLGGRDPSEPVTVEYRIEKGAWVSSYP